MESHASLNILKATERGLGPTEQAVIHNMSVTGETLPSKIAAAINIKSYVTVQTAMQRIVAAGCWPDNVDLPSKIVGSSSAVDEAQCDSTTARSGK